MFSRDSNNLHCMYFYHDQVTALMVMQSETLVTAFLLIIQKLSKNCINFEILFTQKWRARYYT